MRLLHIITGLEAGGAETMLYKLLSRIDRRQFELAVVSLRGYGVLGEKIEALGMPVLTCGMSPGCPDGRGFIRLVRHLQRFKPDVVQTWLYHADLLGGIAARLAGVRHVVWNIRHGNFDPDKNKKHTLLTVRANALLSRLVPESIVCNSKSSALMHQGIGFDADRFAMIPNGFDTGLFCPDPQARFSLCNELEVDPRVPLVGKVARFDPQKNHEGFVAAAAEVSRVIPDACFVLAGPGITWANSSLAGWIDAVSLRGKFRLLGSREDIPKLTAALDVAVCASWGESFPNAVGEAMASGVPCVVCDVGDCAGIVGRAGYVVPAGDMSELACRIVDVLRMPTERRLTVGEEGRRRVMERYSLEAVVRQYESLYLGIYERA